LDKYQPLAARLLEYYESNSSVEADGDTDTEVRGDAGTGLEVGSAAKPRRKTRASVAKHSVSTAAVKVTAVKAIEKKKRKRKTSPPLMVKTPMIATPLTKEVNSDEEEEEDEATEATLVLEERSVRRSLSPAAKRQRELAQKTTEDALRQGLEAQRAVTTTQAKVPILNRLRIFRPKPRVPTITR
jgi:hypothetical protein